MTSVKTRSEVYRVRQRGRQEWRREIIEATKHGWGIVPLFGSGMSLQSGIPIGQQLKDYLYYSLVQALIPREPLNRAVWRELPSDSDIDAAKRVLATLTAVAIHNVKGEDARISIPALADSLGVLEQFIRVETLTRNQTQTLENFTTFDWLEDRAKSSVGDFVEWWKDDEAGRRLFTQRTNIANLDIGFDRTTAFEAERNYILSLHRFWEEWSGTVVFISRLRHTAEQTVYLAERDPVRIDEFNRYITRFKRPNFAHSLIAHLAEPLRISVFLTTNFDTLIEDTFQNFKRPLAVFDVGKAAGLPPTSLVLAQDCVIKLHGTAHDTRADETLQEIPRLVDLERFASYFGYSRGRREHRVPKHLLVMGYSASDLRVVSFIRYAIGSLDDEFRIFWVCHTDGDEETVRKHFQKEVGKKVITCRSNYPDLLLHELYEELTGALPAGGLPFEYIATVPPNPHWGSDADAHHIEQVAERILFAIGESKLREEPTCDEDYLKIERIQARRGSVEHSPSEVELTAAYWALQGPSGMASAVRTAFETLVEKDKVCVWLEADDYPSAEAMVAELFRTLAEKTGKWDVANISLRADEASLGRLVNHYLRINPQHCVLFIWANDVPGMAFGWGTSSWRTRADFEQLHDWLKVLALVGFKVLYFPLTPATLSLSEIRDVLPQSSLDLAETEGASEDDRWIMDPQFAEEAWIPHQMRNTGFDAMLHEVFQWIGGRGHDGNQRLGREKTISAASAPESLVRISNLPVLLEHDTFKKIHSWFDPTFEGAQHSLSWPRLQYLFVSTLFRQSRHYSAMRTKPVLSSFEPFAFGVDQDELRKEIVEGWLDRLETLGVLRTKPGGFYWMRWDTRLTIQHWLDQLECRTEDAGNQMVSLGGIRAISHGRIADWYLAAFRATGNVTPLVESIFHSAQAFRHASRATLRPDRKASLNRLFGSDAVPRDYADVIQGHALKTSINALVVGRSALRLQAQPEFIGKMFGAAGWLDFCRASGMTGDSQARDGLQELVEDLRRLFETVGEDIGTSGTRVRAHPARVDDIVPRYPPVRPVVRGRDDSFQSLADVRSDDSGAMVGQVEDVVNKRLITHAATDCAYACIGQAELWAMFAEGATFIERQLELGRYEGLFDGQVGEKVKASAPHNRAICMAQDACARLARHLDRRFILSCWGETLKMQATAGLALSRLGRFNEARRRLNEAASYTSFLPPDEIPVAAAAVELRRAEMYYLMAARTPRSREDWDLAEFDVSQGNYSRLAYIDDSWNALQRAESHLEGRNRSVNWWGRLFLLRMRVALLLEQLKQGRHYTTERIQIERRKVRPLKVESIAERSGESTEAIVESNFLLGCLLQPKDGMRLLRAIDLKWRFHALRVADTAPSQTTETARSVKDVMTLLDAWQIVADLFGSPGQEEHLPRYYRTLQSRIDGADALREQLMGENPKEWEQIKQRIEDRLADQGSFA